MDAALHRIEALAGNGRYALTFRRVDGGEQTTVVAVADADVSVAAASLPTGWSVGSEPYLAATRAVLALHDSRLSCVAAVILRDVEGGWDVGLGNVALGRSGHPECTAHGVMAETVSPGSDATGADRLWVCAECDARALST